MSEQPSSPDPRDREFTIFNNLRVAALEMMEHGMEFARRDNPTAYAEAQRVVKEGRGRTALVLEFVPFSVSAQLFGADADGEQIKIEFFRFDGKPVS